MIVKDMTNFVSVCDKCGATLQGEQSFIETVNKTLKTGWESEHSHGVWVDMCPSCFIEENIAMKKIVQGQWYDRR